MTLIKSKKDRLATELSLIESATVLFAEKGYENSTTKEIAINAQCNESLIQRYFEGKDGLLLAVLQAGVSKQNATSLERLPYHDELVDEMVQICELTRSFMRDSANEIKIAFSRLLIDPVFYKKFLQICLSRDYQGSMENRLQQYKDRGKIKQNCELAVLVDVMTSMFLQMGFFKPEVFRIDEQEVSARLRFFCEVLAHGLA